MGKKNQKKNKHPSTHSAPIPGKMALPHFAQTVFKERANQFQRNGSAIDSVYEGLDFDTFRIKRRISSVVSVAEEVKARYSEICPDTPGAFSLAEDWVIMNSYPVSAFDHIEKYVFSTLGAAIWLLDHIRDHGKMDELNNILCSAPVCEDVALPDVWDPCHSRQLLQKMVSIINNRNSDCPLTEKAIRKNKATVTRIYMDRATAENKIDHTVPSRCLYDQVIGLIDPQALCEIEDLYKEKHWQWLHRYFLCRALFNQEEQQIRKDIQELQMQMQALATQTALLSQNRKPISILSNAYTAEYPAAVNSLLNPEHLAREKALEFQNKMLYEKQEEFNQQFNAFVREVGEFPLMSFDAIAKKYGEEIARIWENFQMDEPYSMCMAFLSLLDQGSDLPWCYFPSVILQSFYVSMLPWTRTRYIPCCDDIWEHYDSETGSVVPGPTEQPLPKKTKIPDLQNWYQMQFSDTAKSAEENHDLYSLSHILYEATGCLMPRNPQRHLAVLNTLNRYGINSKKENQYLLYCMALLGEAKHQSVVTQLPLSSQTDFASMPDTVEALQDQVASLREELSHYKQLLQDVTNKTSTDANHLAQLQRQLTFRDYLVHDLSSIVFDSKIPKVPQDTGGFHRTASYFTVFSADKDWCSAMKTKLPDVQFFQKITKENAAVLRTADMIWILPKGLSYEEYRQILMEARKSDIPIRIFPFADIASCTALLVQTDISR